MAFKIINPSSKEEADAFMKENICMEMLGHHPNIMSLYVLHIEEHIPNPSRDTAAVQAGRTPFPYDFCFELELCTGGDLFDVVHRHEPSTYPIA